MNKEEALAFVRRFRDGNYTAEEHAAFLEWLRSQPPAGSETLLATYTAILQSHTSDRPAPEGPWHVIESRIRPRRKLRWLPYAAAAAAVLTGVIVLHNLRKDPAPATARSAPSQSASATQRAMLTLSDGSTIALDSAADGDLARQGNTSIVKLGSGQLAYEQEGTNARPAFNTLSTPRGGQYHIVLPDGSKVWLNAASSLRFPTAFAGNDRTVALTGEAYFEIAHNEQMPFRVTTPDGVTVKVLGTHFNVMAYADEQSLRTTLLEGAVALESGGNAPHRLSPGQEGRFDKPSGRMTIAVADIEETMAWKNGLFQFEHADIAAIARQLERWYDVDVQVRESAGARRFLGILSRSTPLTGVVKVLETAGFHCRYENGTLIID
ncbi:FecR family protein [Chitinophaga lutea]